MKTTASSLSWRTTWRGVAALMSALLISSLSGFAWGQTVSGSSTGGSGAYAAPGVAPAPSVGAGAPASGAPAYGAPVYGAPAYGAPSYGAPVWCPGVWCTVVWRIVNLWRGRRERAFKFGGGLSRRARAIDGASGLDGSAGISTWFCRCSQ